MDGHGIRMSGQDVTRSLLSGAGVQGYLAHKKQPPLGPYSRPMPRVLLDTGGSTVSYERGTPVLWHPATLGSRPGSRSDFTEVPRS